MTHFDAISQKLRVEFPGSPQHISPTRGLCQLQMSVAPPPTPLPAPQARHPHGTGGTGGLSPGTKDHGASVGSRVTPTFLPQCREDASQVQLVSTLNCSTWPRCAGKQGQKSTCEWGGEAGIVLTCASLYFDRVSPLLCVFVVLPRCWRHTNPSRVLEAEL